MEHVLFKEAVGTASIVVKESPKTGKLFAVADDGRIFRVQQSLDSTQPIEWIVPNGVLEDAVLVNKGCGARVIATF